MKIELTIEQINVILAALQDAPIAHKHTDPVIRHLVQSVQEASKPDESDKDGQAVGGTD